MSDDLSSNSTMESGLTWHDLTQNSHVVIGGALLPIK